MEKNFFEKFFSFKFVKFKLFLFLFLNMQDLTVTEKRFARYQDFIMANSCDGNYSPAKGLESLLSALTPDLKVVALWAMSDGQVYHSKRKLYRSVLGNLEKKKISTGKFPLTSSALWNYCEYSYKNEKTEGSLVKTGAIVKDVFTDTMQEPKMGYRISDAGSELFIPLGLTAMEFVYRARDSGIPHKHDSMWRVLGSFDSSTEKRRQIAVYKIIKFLVENDNKQYRNQDILDALKEDINPQTIKFVLNSLGNSGIINYESKGLESQGKKEKGFVTYSLADELMLQRSEEELLTDLMAIRPNSSFCSNRGYILKVLEFIKSNPNSIYEYNDICENLSINASSISQTLKALEEMCILKRETDFKGGYGGIMSKAEANELTRMFYNIVLQPAYYSATCLMPMHRASPDRQKLRIFLENYQEERSHLGNDGGEELRLAILSVLQKGERKWSHIYEESMDILDGRELKSKSMGRHLRRLIIEEKIEKTKSGYYHLVQI